MYAGAGAAEPLPHRSMRVALVNTPSRRSRPVSRSMMGGLGFGTGESMLLPPIDLALLAAVLRDEGHDVVLLDPDPAGLDLDATLRALAAARPDATVATTSLPTLEHDAGFLRAAGRATGRPVFAKTFLREEGHLGQLLEASGARAAIVGEPDFLIARILAGKTVEGTATLGPAGVTVHPFDLVTDLDRLPFAARDLLPHDRYAYPLLGSGVTTMQTSRGCPYPCGYYCPYPLVEGVKWRPQSAGRVVDEIADFVARLGIRRILFRDATFTISQQRTLDLCEEILRRGLAVEWWCETRADLLSPELLRAMSRAGCRGINVGVETGDEAVMQTVAKRGLTLDGLARVREAARELGLRLHFLLQVGLPGETRRSVVDTFDLVSRLRPDSAGLTFTTPYPGTPLWHEARKKGWLASARPADFDAHTPILRTATLSRDEIVTGHRAVRRGIEMAVRGEVGTPAWRELRIELLRWAAGLGDGRPRGRLAPPAERLLDRPVAAPRLSVVIPTRDRWPTLAVALAGWANQTLGPGSFELIVVDDGSRDDTRARLAALGELPFGLVVLGQGACGPARARNQGLAAARAPYVLFTGDDIVPEPDLLARHLAAHAADPVPGLAVLGRVEPERGRTPAALRSFLDRTNYEFDFRGLDAGAASDWRHFWTCNLSLATGWMREQGAAFDEDFDGAAWEDVELGYRLARHGLRVRYEPGARARHHHAYGLPDFLRRMRRSGEMAWLLVHKHPELDGELAPVAESLAAPRAGRARRAWLEWTARTAALLTGLGLDAAGPRLDAAYHDLLREAFRDGVRARARRETERLAPLVGLAA